MEEQSQTEFRRIRTDNVRHDSEEQGLRKDSKEQMEFVSNQPTNVIQLNRIVDDNSNSQDKNNLSQLLNQSSDVDVVKSENLSDNPQQ